MDIRIWSLCGYRGVSSVGEETCTVHTRIELSRSAFARHFFNYSIIVCHGPWGTYPMQRSRYDLNDGIMPLVNSDNSS